MMKWLKKKQKTAPPPLQLQEPLAAVSKAKRVAADATLLQAIHDLTEAVLLLVDVLETPTVNSVKREFTEVYKPDRPPTKRERVMTYILEHPDYRAQSYREIAEAVGDVSHTYVKQIITGL